ncbi:MAG: TIR domain-containing protein [Desulfomonilaceae bacterium]
MNVVRRKCFISYHHADQVWVDHFVKTFDHDRNLFIARGLGQTMTQDIIDSTDTDYVMRRIRELYIADSTVTLVMLGKCTWARRYVDWEIQASLRAPQNGLPNGLLGVKLPTYPEGTDFPERLNKNLLSETKKAAGQTDCFARWIAYPQTSDALWVAIEAAFQRRKTHAHLIDNPRDRSTYNRQCE